MGRFLGEREQPGKLEPKIGGTAENEYELRFDTVKSTNGSERTEIHYRNETVLNRPAFSVPSVPFAPRLIHPFSAGVPRASLVLFSGFPGLCGIQQTQALYSTR